MAFAYIEELMRSDSPARKRLDALPGSKSEKIELAAGVFAIEQAYETKVRSDGFFESHQRAIDVQVVLEGEEVMEVIDASRVTVREPFDAARDLVTYHDVPNASKLHLRAGEAAIFFPVDVHMPSLRITASPGFVRKTVVKVPVG